MPPAVALVNYISCGLLSRIFIQTEILAGFLYIYIYREAAMGRGWESIPGLFKRFTNMGSGRNGT